MKKWLLYGALIVIVLTALFLRVYRLNYLELFGDELDAGYQAYSLLTTGRDYKGHYLPLYIESFSEWRAPLLMYVMVPFIKIFGLNEWGVRLTSAFFGLVSIFVFWRLLRFGKESLVVLLGGFLFLAISPWHVQYSRAGFELTLLSSLLLLGVLWFWQGLEGSKIKMIGGAFSFGLSLYAYSTANVYIILLVALVVGIEFARLRVNFKFLTVSLVLLIVVALPIISQVLSGHGADRFRLFSVFQNDVLIGQVNDYRKIDSSFLGKIFINHITIVGKKIMGNYANAFGYSFLLGEGDVTFRHSLHFVGMIYWVQAFLVLIGLIYFFGKRNKSKSEILWLGFLLLSPIPSSLTIDGANHASRLFLMVFPLAYWAGVGIKAVWLSKLWYKTWLLTILGLLLLLFEFGFYQNYYWKHYQRESWRWWQYGYKEVMSDVDALGSSFTKIYIENTYEPALIRYLFWNAYDSHLVYHLDDEMKLLEGNWHYFSLNKKIRFVDYGPNFDQKEMQSNSLYIVSQSRNVPGDWNWGINPPSGIKVLKTIYNPWNQPIFYLVTKNS